MSGVQQLKSRIRSVNSTKQITGAMQLVAASKMRRAIDQATATNAYSKHARQILRHLSNEGATENHPFFVRRPVKQRLLVVYASDNGLAGAYNSNVLKRYVSELKHDREHGIKTCTITIGRKASQFVSRLRDVEVLASFDNLPDQPNGAEIRAIVTQVLDNFRDEKVDSVDLIFTEFISSIKQNVVVEPLLPAGRASVLDEALDTQDETFNAEFEPSRAQVLDAVIDRLIETHLVQALFDARASEHSTRMLAMKNATDNASSLADDLTLVMNKERQAAITQELSEISNGAEAVE